MPDDFIAAIAAATAEAGKLALDRWETDFRRWEKEAGSPVCEAISSPWAAISSGSRSVPSTITARSQVRWFRPT